MRQKIISYFDALGYWKREAVPVQAKRFIIYFASLCKHGGAWDWLGRMFMIKEPTLEKLITKFIRIISDNCTSFSFNSPCPNKSLPHAYSRTFPARTVRWMFLFSNPATPVFLLRNGRTILAKYIMDTA